MIAFLSGEIKHAGMGYVILVSNNIGWKVNTASEIPKGEKVELFIYTHIRESEISLWGFETEAELELFELLISVSGVGPKTAQLLIKTKGILNVVRAIKNGEYEQLRATGVGTKTIQKIVLELRDKITKIAIKPEFRVEENHSTNVGLDVLAEVEDALVNLGYSKKEIQRVLTKIQIDGNQSAEEILKIVLKSI